MTLLPSDSNELLISTNRLSSKSLERFFHSLIWCSIALYVAEEMLAQTEHTREGHPGFLWTERMTASLFTIEYFLRWRESKNRLRYPFTLMALVDLIAVIPFYVGFFVPESALHLIRTLRILRLLKSYRYSAGLQLLALGFYRVREQLKALGFATFVLIFASHAAMYECERHAQPESFRTIGDAFWFTCVTVTTVGYGDMFPITSAGRVVAMLTFVLGTTLFGTFAGVMGSAFAAVLREQHELESEQKNAVDST